MKQGIEQARNILNKDQKGITGLETAIVLIAFVVVASVFAFAVITTGLFSSEEAQSSAQAGVEAAKSTMTPKGSMVLSEAQSIGATSAADATLIDATAAFDDEGVPPQRVSLVEKGVLKTLLASRAPTRKIRHTTGHGRNPGYGDAEATIGCLYLSDDDGLSREELGAELIRAARDEGLPFGLRIASMAASIPGELGTPIYAYKVFVEDGREELVRGLEFTATEPRVMKRILASGTERKVYNSIAGVAASIIAPAVIFEELELNKVEEEFDKRPILKSPAQRALAAADESR